jgi:hypothetical protein
MVPCQPARRYRIAQPCPMRLGLLPQLVESTREDGEGEPLTFEVGAGDIFANEMIKARPPV